MFFKRNERIDAIAGKEPAKKIVSDKELFAVMGQKIHTVKVPKRG